MTKIMKRIFDNFFLKLLIIMSLIILSITSYFLLKDLFEYQENNNDIYELIQDVVGIDSVTQDKIIDWEYLKSVNEDIIGWIEIEDTKVNYPILKDNGNLYYLKHTYNRKFNSNGSIFVTDSNFFNTDETLIYGHNMRNGTMFSVLGNYLDNKFLYSHQNIKIYTPNENYIYKIFSCYSTGIETESNNIKNLNYEERIEYYKNNSKNYIDNAEITGKIIKLSTCSYINAKTRPTDQRYYIIAVLESIENI